MWLVSVAALIGIVFAAFVWYSFGLADNVINIVKRRGVPEDASEDRTERE